LNKGYKTYVLTLLSKTVQSRPYMSPYMIDSYIVAITAPHVLVTYEDDGDDGGGRGTCV